MRRFDGVKTGEIGKIVQRIGLGHGSSVIGLSDSLPKKRRSEAMPAPVKNSATSVCQRFAGQLFAGFPIFGAGAGNDLVRQARARGFLVPVQRFQMVTHVLLVVGRRVAAKLPGILRPETRRIRGQCFINEMQDALFVDTKFKLGVGNDNVPGQRIGGSLGVEGQRGITCFCGDLCAVLAGALEDGGEHRATIDLRLLEGNVLVVIALFGLGRRGEDRFGQTGGELQSGRQFDAADRTGLLVILPPGTDQVAAHHGLDGQRLQAFDHQRAPTHLLPLGGGDHRFRVNAGQLVGQDMAKPFEPEVGQLGEHLALARNRVRQDDVEGRKAIAGHDQQFVVTDGVNVAHLAAPEQGQAGKGRFVERFHGGKEEREKGEG